MQEELIKKYFYAANYIVISQMYLNGYLEDIDIKSLKNYNPGHLGTSMSINFILSNLNYFLKNNNLNSKLVVGTGHAGVALSANLWLNGTMSRYDKKYSQNKKGLDNLIKDFGNTIRSEINPEYPETIYDGGELGYSLGVAYGYAIDSEVNLIPCLIGDGEAETGTLMASWQLNKILKTKSKVLPIINLNGFKMGSPSFISNLTDDEITSYFKSLGYKPYIIYGTDDVIKSIKDMQLCLKKALNDSSPLIVFKSLKGYTLPTINDLKLEGNTLVHKNPLLKTEEKEKLIIIKSFLKKYNTNMFDCNDNLLDIFSNFKNEGYNPLIKSQIQPLKSNNIEEYILSYISKNNGLIFSPDELYSNSFGKLKKYTIEILNENLLQALYQGYVQAGNVGFYIGYEGFMPIISSMITQYYKYLKQKDIHSLEKKASLNYFLTSTCWENTYSHQNPDFVNTLLNKNDKYYNIFYPKDMNSTLKCVENIISTIDKINIITSSKRHTKNYESFNNIDFDIIKDCDNPDFIICATGDYMLDQSILVYEQMKDKQNIKIVYVTKPQILNVNSVEAINNELFHSIFNINKPVIYLFEGYANTIKSLLFGRNIDCEILGYKDEISIFGNFKNNLEANGLSLNDIINLCKDKIEQKKLVKRD